MYDAGNAQCAHELQGWELAHPEAPRVKADILSLIIDWKFEHQKKAIMDTYYV